MVFSSCSCSRVRLAVLSRVYQVRTRVLIHIDNKIIGGSALENSDGVNLPVGLVDSFVWVGGLSCCLGVFIVGESICSSFKLFKFLCKVCAYFVCCLFVSA